MATFYLSSSYQDLKDYRQRVDAALRRAGHTVKGMENYTASGAAPLTTCLADVAKCDAYIGIFAWRYGSIPEKGNLAGKSITELEYLQAIKCRKETLIFLLEEGVSLEPADSDMTKIKTLRDFLSKEHMIDYFRDSAELTLAVVTAANRLRRQAWWKSVLNFSNRNAKLILGALMAVAVVLILVAFVPTLLRLLRKDPPIVNGPPAYPTERKYDFFLTEKETLPQTWRLVPGSWSLVKGEGNEENDAALLISGSQMAVPEDLGGRAFYDYTADLKIRFEAGDKADWVLWAQEDGHSGYLFELTKAGGTLFLKGWVLKDNRKVGEPLAGDGTLMFSKCCNQTDAIHVVADVTNTDTAGTHFKFHITYRSDPGYATKDTATFSDPEFFDSKSTFKWGSIGLLVYADPTSPQAGGVMKVEHVYLTPHRGERGSAEASPDGSAP
ncbi:MAG TPA: DUF4062 domain-containing protein [Pyrinomonadaceae bacterium]|nr:DUF4062 domain-containing protein [Pyrinomonadaceae bacterium]